MFWSFYLSQNWYNILELVCIFFKILNFEPESEFSNEVFSFVANLTGFADPVVILVAEADQVLQISYRISELKDPTPLWYEKNI
jgi:hypothetical protein